MVAGTPAHDQWLRLYQTAIAVRDLAPWKWMLESDLFGFRDPASERLDFVSIMGARGEHLSVAVYLGDAALYDFLRIQNADSPPTAADLFAVPHLKASFESRDQLEEEDRAIIKQLGLKCRGRQAWPMFRSYRPGFFPWFVEGTEVETLICALDQTLAVAPRFKKNPFLLTAPDVQRFLIRMPADAADGTVWSDHLLQVPPPKPQPMTSTVGRKTINKLRNLPRRQTRVEIGFFPLMVPIQAARERPACPYVLMIAEACTGAIIGAEVLQAEVGVEEVWARMPEKAVKVLIEAGIRPAEIAVSCERTAQRLAPVCRHAGVVLSADQPLYVLAEAMGSMVEYLLELDDLSVDSLPAFVGDSLQQPALDWQPHVLSASPSAHSPLSLTRAQALPYVRLRQREVELSVRILADMPPVVIHTAGRDMGLSGPRNTLLLETGDEEDFLLDRCLYDIRTEGATVLERFMASEAGAHLDPEDAAIVQGMAAAHYSLFEVTAVTPESAAIELLDLVDERVFSVTDMNLSHTIDPGILLAARLIGVDDLYMTTGAVCAFNGSRKDALLRGLRPKPPGTRHNKGRRPRPRPRSEYSAYFFRKHRQFGDIRVKTMSLV